MIIDTENLGTLKLYELAVLLLLYDKKLERTRTVLEVKDTDILSILESLEKKELIVSSIYATDFNQKPPFQHNCWALVEKGRQALAENCVQDPKVQKVVSNRNLKKRFEELAPKLMEIYPLGTKPGTSLKWRGNVATITEKLLKVYALSEFTDEEAIAATKNYVNSFNGDYTTMRVLMYFICKNLMKGGEVERTRDFLSYIEDVRSNPQQATLKKDWDIELK